MSKDFKLNVVPQICIVSSPLTLSTILAFRLKKVFNFITTIKSKSANIILKLVNFKGDYDLDVTADPPKTNPAAA